MASVTMQSSATSYYSIPIGSEEGALHMASPQQRPYLRSTFAWTVGALVCGGFLWLHYVLMPSGSTADNGQQQQIVGMQPSSLVASRQSRPSGHPAWMRRALGQATAAMLAASMTVQPAMALDDVATRPTLLGSDRPAITFVESSTEVRDLERELRQLEKQGKTLEEQLEEAKPAKQLDKEIKSLTTEAEKVQKEIQTLQAQDASRLEAKLQSAAVESIEQAEERMEAAVEKSAAKLDKKLNALTKESISDLEQELELLESRVQGIKATGPRIVKAEPLSEEELQKLRTEIKTLRQAYFDEVNAIRDTYTQAIQERVDVVTKTVKEQVKSRSEQVKQTLQEAAERTAREVKRQAKAYAEQVTTQLKTQVTQLREQAKVQLKLYSEQTKQNLEKAAKELPEVAAKSANEVGQEIQTLLTKSAKELGGQLQLIVEEEARTLKEGISSTDLSPDPQVARLQDKLRSLKRELQTLKSQRFMQEQLADVEQQIRLVQAKIDALTAP